MRVLRCAAASAAAVLALAAGGAGGARADDGIAIAAAGEPSWFQLSARPEHAVAGRLLVTNLTGARKRVRLDAVDVGVAASGGLSYGIGRPLGAGRWLTPRTQTVTLAPHEQRAVTFSVRAPRRSAGGDHFAALTATSGAPAHAGARHGRRRLDVRFVSRLAIAVQVRLPGARRAQPAVGRARIAVRGLPALILPLANRGSGLLAKARLRLTVRGGRRRLLRIDQPLGAFVPHGTLDFTVPWPGRPLPGRYRVDGRLTAAGRALAIHQTLVVAPPGARATRAASAGAGALAARPGARPRPLPWREQAPLYVVGAVALGVGSGVGFLLRR